MQGHNGAGRGSRPRVHGRVDGGCDLDEGASGRFFLCALCRRQVLICSHCDRGQIYCAGDCRIDARRMRRRETASRYQRSRTGRFTHAARSRRYRARQKIVTHHGSPAPPPNACVSEVSAAAREEPPPGAGSRREKIWGVVRVASGNFLEMYDFFVYGYFAVYIARTFFPTGNAFTSLMLSLGTFAAGFLMRPLGALILGSYIDRKGRRIGLIVTLSLMAVGTLTIALTPGYDTIGLIAPLVVLAGRLVQGFSAGCELGGVSVYLAEIATPGHRGFYCSFQSASQQVAVVFASFLGVVLNSIIPAEQMAAWGWRIPLLIGCLIAPLILYLRSSLKETEEFQSRRHHPSASEALRIIGRNWAVVLEGVMLSSLTTGLVRSPSHLWGLIAAAVDSAAAIRALRRCSRLGDPFPNLLLPHL